TPFVLAEGQRMTDIAIHVERGAVIEGTLRDERGRPIAAAQVSAWAQQFVEGQAQLAAAPGRASRVLTDDRGRFRIWGLLPGTYVVEATGSSGAAAGIELLTDDGIDVRTVTRGVVYAPGVSRAQDAMPITLALGEERTGLDIVNPVASSAKLTVVVTSDAGLPQQNVGIGVASLASRRVSFSPGFVRPDADGRFTLPGLSPGRYLFYGRSAPAAAGQPSAGLWLSTEVEVGAADAEVALVMKPGQTVSGKLSADGVASIGTTALLSLGALPDIPGTASSGGETRAAEDGSFVFTNVPPGRYELKVSAPGGWKLMSAILDGKDVLDTNLEVREGADVSALAVRLGKTTTRVSGLVTDALGRPSPEFSVVVFAADPALRRASGRRTSGLIKIGSDGRYTVDDLPPGAYLLAVVVDGDPQQLSDPAFFTQIASGAIAITLAEGQSLVQDLKIGG
ncbi:MAG: carboxypeptidase regulatory-like domain-containing protein, partial [Acidobacteria bacterium]|nr:carboxypeptidase regulatory-like domain-containing protein [Acidobacteriota bacterium]